MARTIVLPTNPADIKKIKDGIQEASNSLVQIDAEKDQIKSIVDLLAEKYELPKQFINKMIKSYHKSDFDKTQTQFEDWAELYQLIVK